MFHLQRHGHEVFLLTLTKGEATKQRLRLGVDKKEMGNIRYKEMLAMQKVLGITRMDVWAYPDGGLKDLDPRPLENDIMTYLKEHQPDVVITYPVHGISGFYDHLVCHAVVKRVFVEWKEGCKHPARLAFFGPREEQARHATHWIPLKGLTDDEIDCTVCVDEEDIEANKQALDCYVTYRSTVEESGIKKMLHPEIHFTFFGENHTPPLTSVFEAMK